MNLLFFLSFLTATISVCASAVGSLSGVEVEKEFDVPGRYETLKVSNAISVEYSKEADRVKVIADSLALEAFRIISDDDCLELKMEYKSSLKKFDARVKVILPYNPKLEEVYASGESSVVLDGLLRCDDFDLLLSGASRFYGEVDAEDVEINVSGASSANIAGNAEDLELKVSGASRVSSADRFVTAEEVEVAVSGASTVTVGCTRVIRGHASGASIVNYTKDCRCEVSLSGASKLKAR